jgi:hypothetical protein
MHEVADDLQVIEQKRKTRLWRAGGNCIKQILLGVLPELSMQILEARRKRVVISRLSSLRIRRNHRGALATCADNGKV